MTQDNNAPAAITTERIDHFFDKFEELAYAIDATTFLLDEIFITEGNAEDYPFSGNGYIRGGLVRATILLNNSLANQMKTARDSLTREAQNTFAEVDTEKKILGVLSLDETVEYFLRDAVIRKPQGSVFTTTLMSAFVAWFKERISSNQSHLPDIKEFRSAIPVTEQFTEEGEPFFPGLVLKPEYRSSNVRKLFQPAKNRQETGCHISANQLEPRS